MFLYHDRREISGWKLLAGVCTITKNKLFGRFQARAITLWGNINPVWFKARPEQVLCAVCVLNAWYAWVPWRISQVESSRSVRCVGGWSWGLEIDRVYDEKMRNSAGYLGWCSGGNSYLNRFSRSFFFLFFLSISLRFLCRTRATGASWWRIHLQ